MPSLHIKKTFMYRGALEEWENGYHFDGGTPATQAAWHALADAIVTAEAQLFTAAVEIVGAVGYALDGSPSVFNATYTTPGAGVIAGGFPIPGYNTMNLRYLTDQRTSKGHPIYLRNYYHGAEIAAGDTDTLLLVQHTALQHFGNLWVTGFSDGSVTHKRAGPNGAVAQVATASQWVGHRTLRRRG